MKVVKSIGKIVTLIESICQKIMRENAELETIGEQNELAGIPFEWARCEGAHAKGARQRKWPPWRNEVRGREDKKSLPVLNGQTLSSLFI